MDIYFKVKNTDAESLAEKLMATFQDPSHEFSHVKRVVKNALEIAKVENDQVDSHVDFELVYLVALFHDVADHKYDSKEHGKIAKQFLAAHYSEKRATEVQELSSKISWSKEQRLLASGQQLTSCNNDVLFIVQDADRLDAIGAVGIARCFSHGGAKTQSLRAQREHFSEKLLRISAAMKTRTGRELAKNRHETLLHFCRSFDDEVGDSFD